MATANEIRENARVTEPGLGKVPVGTKLLYGVGAIAYGIKENGYSTFLLLFYNQVIGLPAATVGLVIGVALFFDAMIDPLIGILSDRTRTRWGRRHPWLYASALPIALSWLLLWYPPHGSQTTILAWLLVTAVFTRAMVATNEVPSYALAPELSRDYHERTSVIRYRYVFAWAGGLAMLILAYGVFLAPPLGSPTGPLALGGYHRYAMVGSIVMLITVLTSAVGTHRFTMSLPQTVVPRLSVAQTLTAVRETLSNKAFIVLMVAGVLTYTMQGVSFSLSNYLLAFVWGFGPSAFVYYSLALMLGVFGSFVLAPALSRPMGKVRSTAVLTVLAAGITVLPYWLRLLHAFPSTGSSRLLPVFLIITVFSVMTGVAAVIIAGSMMSDVVEAAEEKTGRREEGLFFSGALFMQKASSGLGILITGQLLAFAEFPAKALPGRVDVAILDRLTLTFSLLYFGLSVIATLIFLRFPFGKAEHDARIARLSAAAGAIDREKGLGKAVFTAP